MQFKTHLRYTPLLGRNAMRSVLTALCLFATTAHAVPAQFTHQGRLLDAEGAPLEADTTITFFFSRSCR